MRRLLAIPFPIAVWPRDVYVTGLSPEAAQNVHDLLVLGYASGGGSVGAYLEWWEGLRGDTEFDAALCFLAWDRQGLVGVAQCWTSAFVKDLVVHPRRRGEGIGEALLLRAFAEFKERGAERVELKVHGDNEEALRLYRRVGMKIIEA